MGEGGVRGQGSGVKGTKTEVLWKRAERRSGLETEEENMWRVNPTPKPSLKNLKKKCPHNYVNVNTEVGRGSVRVSMPHCNQRKSERGRGVPNTKSAGNESENEKGDKKYANKKKQPARFFNVFNLSVRAVVLPRLMRVNFQQHCLRTASESFKGHRNRKRSEREQTREGERSAAAA